MVLIAAATFNTLCAVLACSLISLFACVTISYFPQALKRFGPLVLSFGAGAMLGDVFFHILPHSLEGSNESTIYNCGGMILAGVVTSYLIESVIEIIQSYGESRLESNTTTSLWLHIKPIAATNLLCDLVHNAIDGISIALAFMASPAIGFTTTMAILAHELAQELGDFVILVHAGMSFKQATLANVGVSFSSLLSAVVTLYLGSGLSSEAQNKFISFAAGAFLYMALVDILPEAMGSHSHVPSEDNFPTCSTEEQQSLNTGQTSSSGENPAEIIGSSSSKVSSHVSPLYSRVSHTPKPGSINVSKSAPAGLTSIQIGDSAFFPVPLHQHNHQKVIKNFKLRFLGLLGLLAGIGSTVLVGLLENHDHSHDDHDHSHSHNHSSTVQSLSHMHDHDHDEIGSIHLALANELGGHNHDHGEHHDHDHDDDHDHHYNHDLKH